MCPIFGHAPATGGDVGVGVAVGVGVGVRRGVDLGVAVGVGCGGGWAVARAGVALGIWGPVVAGTGVDPGLAADEDAPLPVRPWD